MTDNYRTRWVFLDVTIIARYEFPLIPYPGSQYEIWLHWIPALGWVLPVSVFWCPLRSKVQFKEPCVYFYTPSSLVCWQRNLGKFRWAHKTQFIEGKLINLTCGPLLLYTSFWGREVISTVLPKYSHHVFLCIFFSNLQEITLSPIRTNSLRVVYILIHSHGMVTVWEDLQFWHPHLCAYSAVLQILHP